MARGLEGSPSAAATGEDAESARRSTLYLSIARESDTEARTGYSAAWERSHLKCDLSELLEVGDVVADELEHGPVIDTGTRCDIIGDDDASTFVLDDGQRAHRAPPRVVSGPTEGDSTEPDTSPTVGLAVSDTAPTEGEP